MMLVFFFKCISYRFHWFPLSEVAAAVVVVAVAATVAALAALAVVVVVVVADVGVAVDAAVPVVAAAAVEASVVVVVAAALLEDKGASADVRPSVDCQVASLPVVQNARPDSADDNIDSWSVDADTLDNHIGAHIPDSDFKNYKVFKFNPFL